MLESFLLMSIKGDAWKIAANATIATLPAGYRPTSGYYFPCIILNNANMKCSYAQVLTTGAINIQEAMTAGSYIIFDSTFIMS